MNIVIKKLFASAGIAEMPDLFACYDLESFLAVVC
jgi:hypothetical protein